MDRALAIVSLRFKLYARSVRGSGGVFHAIASALLMLLGALFSLGAGVGLAILVHILVQGGEVERIRAGFLIVCWLCFVLGIVVPLLRGAIDQGFDASPFVIFPVGRRSLYGIMLAAYALGPDQLLYPPILLGAAITGVLLPGVGPWVGLLLLALVALFLLVWGNLLSLLVVSAMRARHVREIVAVAALLLLIGASFAPVMLEGEDGMSPSRMQRGLESTMRILSVFPPSIAAQALANLHGDAPDYGLRTSLVQLLLWNAAGLVLGYFVFSRYHLRERGVRVGAGRERRGASVIAGLFSLDRGPFGALPTEIRAVAAKDFHYLLRSVVGRFVLVVTPVFVLFMTFAVGKGLDEPVFGIDPERLVLFGLLLYSVLFSNNFLYNAFAWEGDGVKSYFLSPVSLRRVLIGKNLAVWLYNVIMFVVVLTCFSLARGVPDPLTLASGLFLYVAALLVFTGFGNILSIYFPTPRDMSTARNQPAQIAILLSLVVLVLTGILLGPFVSLPMLLGYDLLQPFLLAGVAGAAAVLYGVTLRQAERLFAERREQLIEALKTAR